MRQKLDTAIDPAGWFRLDGEVAVVTGAGIGRAIAQTLAGAGMGIMAVDLSEEDNDHIIAQLRWCGGRPPHHVSLEKPLLSPPGGIKSDECHNDADRSKIEGLARPVVGLLDADLVARQRRPNDQRSNNCYDERERKDD